MEDNKLEIPQDILRQVKALVAAECADYQASGPSGTKNYCWARERTNAGVCVYFNLASPECTYFETSVLPLNEDLREEYQTLKEEIPHAGENECPEPNAGKRACEVSRNIQNLFAKDALARLPMGEPCRESLLSRQAFHGMGFKK